jgi:hypothetical protein
MVVLREWVWSLYMLKMRIVPHLPVSWIAVMSGHSIGSADQLSEDNLVFTSINDLVRNGLSMSDGYYFIHNTRVIALEPLCILPSKH